MHAVRFIRMTPKSLLPSKPLVPPIAQLLAMLREGRLYPVEILHESLFAQTGIYERIARLRIQ